jgi:tetratricopeptide (TPR) repeat protein
MATASFDHEPAPLCFPQKDFQNTNKKLTYANELFEAALYTKAIDAYKTLIGEILSQLSENKDDLLLMQARFHLAQVYFSLQNYRDAATTLDENILSVSKLSQKSELIKNHSLYLKALALKNLGESAPAKHSFLSYIHSKTPLFLPFYEEALFEIALIDFQERHFGEAAKTFEMIKTEKSKPRLYTLANLYLARIAQEQNNHPSAAAILESLNTKIGINDPLFFELNFLQGETAFQTHKYAQAIESFKKALPPTSPEKYPWYAESLYHLGWSYFKIGDETANDPAKQSQFLKKAEETFNLLVNFSKEENAALALAQSYLSQATRLLQPEYYAKAEALLSKEDTFLSKEAKAHALLLRAEAAPSYATRDQFYKLLTEQPNDSIFYAKGWYMMALNDFDHGQQLLQTKHSNAAAQSLKRSALAFRKAFELLQGKDRQQAGAALKYQALATGRSTDPEADLLAFQILDDLLHHQPHLWEVYPNQDEVHYLHGYFAGRVADKIEKEKYQEIARQSLQTAASTPQSLFGDQALSYLGALYYKNNNHEQAEATYLQLTKTYPASPLAAEAWVWAACCADLTKDDPKIGKQRRQYAYENFPDSPFAAEAFFTFYTYPEYLQGEKSTIKHLQSFTDRYTDSPFLIDAHYLIGLDYKRDRKTAEGRWIRKKSLTDAIDSFQKAESHFDELSEKNNIPPEKMDYYTAMRYRATLERAMANLAIADEAQGAKKQIYLDYAEEVFKNLSNELQQKQKPHVERLFQENAYPLIEEECSFWLAQTYIKADKDNEASRTLTAMADKYNRLNTTKGYYLSRNLDEQGRIAIRSQDYQKALDLFKMAEEAAKGNVLSADQKLDLWIQQSLAYRGLGQFDDALLILSKVVNDDAVSSLRMKAMFLRAETYELQKRPELARKQLESMVKKGGVWARKAQEKLDKEDLNYGH